MLKAYKYRIYPTEAQKGLIEKHIGACRFVYNLALETKQASYKSGRNLSKYDLIKQMADLKKDCPWMFEVNSQSLQQSILDLDKAYKAFLTGISSFPRFKKKSHGGSFTALEKTLVNFDKNKLKILKFPEGIDINLHRYFTGRVKRCTISKSGSGKYFASLLVDTDTDLPIKTVFSSNAMVGVDLGLKSFLVTSSGETVDNPIFLRKSLSKLKYVQRKCSKYKGKRTRKRLAIIHEKVANQRKDFLHKTSTILIKNHNSIAIEDLAVSNMVKNHKLALSISDAGWYEFKRQLGYKADWYGKNLLKIGRFEPSSKTCSICGSINHNLTLKDREWACKCGVLHDRDLNAAINIKNFALKNYLSGIDRGNRNELPALAGVLTSERP